LADIWVLPIYRYQPRHRCWQNAVIFFTHPDNLLKKAQQSISKSRQLSCNNARPGTDKQADKMNHGARVSHRSRNKNNFINQIN